MFDDDLQENEMLLHRKHVQHQTPCELQMQDGIAADGGPLSALMNNAYFVMAYTSMRSRLRCP
jgi:hypothetical protein